MKKCKNCKTDLEKERYIWETVEQNLICESCAGKFNFSDNHAIPVNSVKGKELLSK